MFEKLAKLRFQFYLSSIKSAYFPLEDTDFTEFQFYLSSIKRYWTMFGDLKNTAVSILP